jgi:hypothetical protein
MVKRKDNLELLAGGLLGGFLGNAIKYVIVWIVTLVTPIKSSYLGVNFTVLLMALAGMIPATIVGVIVAVVIILASKKRNRSFGLLSRAIIGASVSTISFLAIKYTAMVSSHSLVLDSILYMDFGIIVGVLAGMMVGRQYYTA